jgi:hypothetical protein
MRVRGYNIIVCVNLKRIEICAAVSAFMVEANANLEPVLALESETSASIQWGIT